MNDYEKVANWIIEGLDSDDAQHEVAWVLKLLVEEEVVSKQTFKESYIEALRCPQII